MPTIPWELSSLLRTLHANHSSVCNIRVCKEHTLKLRRWHCKQKQSVHESRDARSERRSEEQRTLEALVLNELLAPVNNVEEPIGVARADVARLEPPVRGDRFCRRSRIVQIPLHKTQMKRVFSRRECN